MGKLTDKLVGQGTAPELSPNPNGSGYTKQVEIISHNGSTIYFLDGDGNTQTGTAEENVLYLEGEIKYKYLRTAIINPGTNEIVVPAGWVRVENGPNSYKKDGGRGTPVNENTHPQKQPKIFNEPVALNGGVTIKGKNIEDLIGGSSGKKIYVHNIVLIEKTSGEDLYLEIKSNSPTPFTMNTFKQWLIDNEISVAGNFDHARKYLLCWNVNFSFQRYMFACQLDISDYDENVQNYDAITRLTGPSDTGWSLVNMYFYDSVYEVK